MRIIGPTLHAVIDYVAVVVFLVLPFVLGLPGSAPQSATWISVGSGFTLLAYSLVTGFSLSLRKLIPFRAHLVLDFSFGVAFLIVPFVLGYEGVALWYYVVLGIGVPAFVLLTDAKTAAA